MINFRKMKWNGRNVLNRPSLKMMRRKCKCWKNRKLKKLEIPICAPNQLICGRIHKSIRKKETSANDMQKTKAEKRKPDVSMWEE